MATDELKECPRCHVLAERVEQLDKRLDERIIAVEKGIYQRFDSEEILRNKLEALVNARLEGMNEFRRQLDRQAGTFVTAETFQTLNKQSAGFVTWANLFTVSTTIALLVATIAEVIARLIK